MHAGQFFTDLVTATWPYTWTKLNNVNKQDDAKNQVLLDHFPEYATNPESVNKKSQQEGGGEREI